MRLDRRPASWEDRLVLFTAHLINENKQSATIRSYLSAMRTVLKQEGVVLHEDQFLITSLTKACKLCNDKLKLRLPIQKGMLSIIIRKTKQYFEVDRNQPYLSVLFQTIFTVAYFGLFRIGELAYSEHSVRAQDVFIGTNKKKFLFILRSSKTHNKETRPQSIKVSSQRRLSSSYKAQNTEQLSVPCPYQLLNRYRALRGPCKADESDRFFVYSDGSNVTTAQVQKCLKNILKLAGFSQRHYSFHSFHARRTHDLLKLGLSIETIKKIGRWQSNAIFKYLDY